MRARAALLAAAGLLLAGCGIPTTGVVEAGEPAAGVQQVVKLYFVRAQDRGLATMSRSVNSPVAVAKAVTMLLDGPAPEEQKTLTTDLPPGTSAETVRTVGGGVTVRLWIPAGPVSRTAVDQVVCTVRANLAGGTSGAGTAEVTVTAGGVPVSGLLGNSPCPTGKDALPFKQDGGSLVRPSDGVSGG